MTRTEKLCSLWLAEFCLWFAELDLAIAEATGRRPSSITQLRKDVAYWQGIVHRKQINERYS